MKLLMDVIRLAFETDSTRFMTLHLNGNAGAIPIEGVTQGYHALSHHGRDDGKIDQLTLVESEIVLAWGQFLKQLKAFDEGGVSLLDWTNVLMTSNLGNASSHDNKNLPVLLTGGGFCHGQHLAFDRNDNYPLGNLFVSLLQRHGIETDRFSTARAPMSGLEMVWLRIPRVMTESRWKWPLLGCLAGVVFGSGALSAVSLSDSLVQFFEENCYDCHNGDDREGELDLESLVFEPSDRADLKRWVLVYDRVRTHEMPPRGEPDGRTAFLEEFESVLHDVSRSHQEAKGRVRSRRLNRIEFENAIHHLLGIDLPIRELLPEDATQDGFSNVAEAQPVSYHLLEKYMDIVNLSLEEAFRRAIEPEPRYLRFFEAEDLSDNFNVNARRDRQPLFKDGYAVAIACNNNYHGRMAATRVPATGWYRFKIRAKAFNPPEGRGVWTQIRSGDCSAKAPRLFWVGRFLAEEEVKEFVFETWMVKGHRLELRPGDRTLSFAPVKTVNNGQAVENSAIGTAVESIHIERIYQGAEPNVLREQLFRDVQVDRLLADRKSEAFVKNIADHWLSLKDIDFTTPDRILYPKFDEILKHAMVDETYAFLREMIDSDASVSDVIDSDFAMLDERLAQHYGIDNVRVKMEIDLSGDCSTKKDSWIEDDAMKITSSLVVGTIVSIRSEGIAHPRLTQFGPTITGGEIHFDNLKL